MFDQFWNSGIKKTGKKDCEPLFKKILSKSADKESFTQMLVIDIQKRIELCQLGFENLNPKTYLNGERWKDDYPKPQGASYGVHQQPNQQGQHQRLSTIELATQQNAEYARQLQEQIDSGAFDGNDQALAAFNQ